LRTRRRPNGGAVRRHGRGRIGRQAEQRLFVRDLQVAGIYFNGMTASHPALPFGGVKRSGYGRELSEHGIREFCNVTTVWHGTPVQPVAE
jgi:succinate-semialdehyde dehydrogenase/glutarate-semialdehyde dehydrogenase